MAQLYYSPVTVNTGQVPSTQSDFPILISYTDARFKTTGNGGHVANTNGYDIRPYSDSGLTTALTYELERYNASTGEVIMWVKRSSLADGNVTYLGYGDTSLTTNGSSTATWSNAYDRVYHYKDGSSLDISDSTGNTSPTNHGATATAGKIDGGVNTASASSQYIDGGMVTKTYNSGITLSGWLNITSYPAAYSFPFGFQGVVSTESHTCVIFATSGHHLAYYIFTNDLHRSVFVDPGSASLSTGTWYYATLVYDGTNGLKTYVNASTDGTAAANGTSLTSGGVPFYIGQDPYTAGRFFNGSIDEVHLAATARSANWITTEYRNQSAPSTFATLGTEVATGAGATRSGWFVFF